ncbi:hypothetical protein [Azospirillum palustre]
MLRAGVAHSARALCATGARAARQLGIEARGPARARVLTPQQLVGARAMLRAGAAHSARAVRATGLRAPRASLGSKRAVRRARVS